MIDLGALADLDNLTVGAAAEKKLAGARPAGLQPALYRQVIRIKHWVGIDRFTAGFFPEA